MSIRVILVDDHQIVRQGLRGLLEREPDIEVVAEAENGRAAVKLAQEMLPDVVIMDVAMPDLNGVEATRQIIAEAPGVRVLALSMYSDRHFIIGMLGAGAAGYLPKDCAVEELAQALHTVMVNHTYLSPVIIDTVVRDYIQLAEKTELSVFSILTNREREVFQLLVEGMTSKGVAHQLGLSVKTVQTYRQHIMEKLDIHNVAELTKYAIREGMTPADR